ncbi:MAG: glycosyltransferase [Sedimenticola sp.]
MSSNDVVLSVAIVTYNSQEIINDCLDSIYKYNDLGDQLEIILVDNSPADSSAELFRTISREYSDVVLIRSEHNGGYGYGNNLGINAAHGRYILILNPDTRLTMPLFKAAIAQLEDEFTVIVGVKLIYEDFSPQISFFFRPEYQNVLTKPLTKLLNRTNMFSNRLMITSGSCMFMRKDKFVEIGMFDDGIFLGNEEAFIAKKFILADRKNRFVFMKNHMIIHLYKESGCSAYSLKTLCDSHLYYFKHFDMSYKLFYYNKLILHYIKYMLSFLTKDESGKSLFSLEIQTIKSVFRQ